MAAQKKLERLIEDRARFPDQPDDIGRMIQAHYSNLKHGKESSDDYARQAMQHAAYLCRLLEDVREILENKKPRSKQARIDSAVLLIRSRPTLGYITPTVAPCR